MGCQSSIQNQVSPRRQLKIHKNQSQNKFKGVLLGNAGVGKSTLASQYITGKTVKQMGPTVGGVFYKKVHTTENGTKITLNLWDTAGEEKYRAMAPLYYRDASVAILVFDLCDKTSLKSIDYWIEQLDHKITKQKMIMYIVGNKLDSSSRCIKQEDLSQFFRKHQQLIYAQVSAKTGEGVQQLFQEIFQNYIQIISQYQN